MVHLFFQRNVWEEYVARYINNKKFAQYIALWRYRTGSERCLVYAESFETDGCVYTFCNGLEMQDHVSSSLFKSCCQYYHVEWLEFLGLIYSFYKYHVKYVKLGVLHFFLHVILYRHEIIDCDCVCFCFWH